MANFISTIRIQTVAIWGILCAPSPLFALPLAAQDDVGAPSNSTPEAQIPPSPTPSLRQMAHEETTNAIKQTAPETPAKSPKAKHSASASTPHPSSERFVYRDKLAIADLKRLQNIDGWFLKAAWAVVNKVHWRKQSLLSYTFHDVNDDGAYEAIVLAHPGRHGLHVLLALRHPAAGPAAPVHPLAEAAGAPAAAAVWVVAAAVPAEAEGQEDAADKNELKKGAVPLSKS